MIYCVKSKLSFFADESRILQKFNGLQNEKTGNIVISENVSGDVPMAGLEPALYC